MQRLRLMQRVRTGVSVRGDAGSSYSVGSEIPNPDKEERGSCTMARQGFLLYKVMAGVPVQGQDRNLWNSKKTPSQIINRII